jgi:hypothetical protein
MKHLRLLFLLLAISAVSCSTDDAVGMPKLVSQFINNYFPTYGVETFARLKSGYWVKLKSGPSLNFDDKMQWSEINGYGQTISQFFLFDQLPPAIYEYLQETENLSNVYAIVRDAKQYFVSLFDSMLTYRIADARISVAYD